MDGLTLVGIAIVVLVLAYAIYGRWLVKIWGIDPGARTPAIRFRWSPEFSPASRSTVFAHQVVSIMGAGPVTGPIIAAMFGWLPAFLWLLIGGVFFGAVQDLAVLYASVKNDGKSMGTLIERYVGRRGRRLLLLFSWLFSILIIAVYADILATTFAGTNADGTRNVPGAVAGTISLHYIFMAIIFGFFVRNVQPGELLELSTGAILIIGMFIAGLKVPLSFDVLVWRWVVFGYCFAASVLPMWALMQPRDYLSSFLLLGMISLGAVGLMVETPKLGMPAFVGFVVNDQPLFPILFITITCAAVSGFHSLVSSGTTSKSIADERDILPVGYGAMLIEVMLGVVALVIVCSRADGAALPEGTPFQLFAGAVGGFLTKLGMPRDMSAAVMTMCLSALTMTTVDSAARLGRMSWQELSMPAPGKEMGLLGKILTKTWVAAGITMGSSYVLCQVGYASIWALFGSVNQLLSALVLVALVVFLRVTGRKGWMLWVPMTFLFATTMSALAMALWRIYGKIVAGQFVLLTDGLQSLIAMALMMLAWQLVWCCVRELRIGEIDGEPAT
ncbi:MAG: hypothetical protein IJR14_11585 [Synergistaceae bacterium]|nr:hypothetical protein [Synergistaceae bacterium]